VAESPVTGRFPFHGGRVAALSLLAAATASCIFTTSSSPSAARHRLAYRLSVGGDPANPSCAIRIRILDWPAGEPLVFQAPRYYADNPGLPIRGLEAADILASDFRGRPLAARDTALESRAVGGNFIALPRGAVELSYEVDLDPGDPGRFGLPMPGLAPGVQAIDGASFFLLPQVGDGYTGQWRTPVDATLDFDLGPGFDLAGQSPSAVLRTNYELMFVRAAVNPVVTHRFPAGDNEIITYGMTAAASDSVDWPALHSLLGACLRVVEDSLLTFPPGPYYVGETPVFWGIEGNQGYWFRAAVQGMAILHVHELVHHFVGVKHGDLEDPWWKEGMTSYLGNLLALQAGLVTDSAFRAELMVSRDALPAVLGHALASSHVRDRLFLPLDSLYMHQDDPVNFLGLVYGKGAQASMILDRHLLEHSGGRHGVYHLIRLLIRRHGPAFARADLVRAVGELSGTDSRGFLESLLDRPGPLGQDSLESTYAALKAMGRLLHSSTVAKRGQAGEQPVGPAAPDAGLLPADGRPGLGKF
jgi:hypothetical protein